MRIGLPIIRCSFGTLASRRSSVCFFFSSRRRHTRSLCDWSSDVCSSDLTPLTPLRCLRYAEQQYSHRTAIVCGNERFTYAEFADRAARLGGALKNAVVEPGDRVAFLSMNCHRLLEAYYGVLEAGAVLLPLNVRLASQDLIYIL